MRDVIGQYLRLLLGSLKIILMLQVNIYFCGFSLVQTESLLPRIVTAQPLTFEQKN